MDPTYIPPSRNAPDNTPTNTQTSHNVVRFWNVIQVWFRISSSFPAPNAPLRASGLTRSTDVTMLLTKELRNAGNCFYVFLLLDNTKPVISRKCRKTIDYFTIKRVCGKQESTGLFQGIKPKFRCHDFYHRYMFIQHHKFGEGRQTERFIVNSKEVLLLYFCCYFNIPRSHVYGECALLHSTLHSF